MPSSCLGDRKEVQDSRFDSLLTGVKKESFYWLTKTIAHTKRFPRKWKQIRHVEKRCSVKTKSAVLSFSSFSSGVFWKLDISRLHLSSVGPCKKENAAKGKEAFQGKFVVIVEGFARNFFWAKPSNFCQFIFVFNCDLRQNFQTLTRIFFLGKVT